MLNLDKTVNLEHGLLDRFGWRCEHRHPTVLGAVRIRSVSASKPICNTFVVGYIKHRHLKTPSKRTDTLVIVEIFQILHSFWLNSNHAYRSIKSIRFPTRPRT